MTDDRYDIRFPFGTRVPRQPDGPVCPGCGATGETEDDQCVCSHYGDPPPSPRSLSDDEIATLAAMWVSYNPRARVMSREQTRFQADALLDGLPDVSEADVDAWLDAVDDLLKTPEVAE